MLGKQLKTDYIPSACGATNMIIAVMHQAALDGDVQWFRDGAQVTTEVGPISAFDLLPERKGYEEFLSVDSWINFAKQRRVLDSVS